MPGRPPNPASLRLVTDEASHRKPRPRSPGSLPAAPGWLQGEGRRVWNQVVADLADFGTLCRTDQNVLARYCETFVQWLEAVKSIREDGMVYRAKGDKGQDLLKRNPAVQVADMLSKTLLAHERELGLTSAARNRLGAAPQEAPDDEDEKMLG